MNSKRFVLAAVICFFFMGGCGEKIDPGVTPQTPKVVKAETAVVEITHQPVFFEAVGTIQAKTASMISGKIIGSVMAMNVSEGDLVKSGEVLLELDHRQVASHERQADAALEEARKGESAALSGLEAARAQANLARTTYNRYLELKEADSVSRQEFDEIFARLKQAEAGVSQAEANLAAARQRVSQAGAAMGSATVTREDATIEAPYDAIVTKKLVNLGDLVTPGMPLISLEKIGAIQAVVVLSETRIQSVMPGKKVSVLVSAAREEPFEGVVETIVPSADEQSRSFLVKVNLPPHAKLRSGLFARVTIPEGEGGMILISEKAIVRQGQLTGVFIVDKDLIARFRLIRTGRKYDDKVAVLTGLAEGARYVLNPGISVKNGVKVEDVSHEG